MTYAVVPALRVDAELAETYEPLLTSREYDPELKAPTIKAGITAGMSMTEKAGRLRRARRDYPGDTQRQRSTASPGTSGSRPRRCATCSWCWRRHPVG